ncbi:hypothetical protein ACIRVF_33630 [Kitasatospora sp. NPDC101157]|uniref:hypothetical protein n=1 Tax=Kitasatospora sp. NPDC101157 TaxID=3364098 RepID=UPI00382A2B6C
MSGADGTVRRALPGWPHPKGFLGGVHRQDTFNRHLSAHKASPDTYRSAFAFAALLNTQALLRLVDRYLYV